MVVNHLMFADDICVFGLSISGLQCSLMQNRRQKAFNRQARGGRLGLAPPKIYESNFIHHNFVQFGKQNSRIKTISSFTILLQQCCGANYISLTV